MLDKWGDCITRSVRNGLFYLSGNECHQCQGWLKASQSKWLSLHKSWQFFARCKWMWPKSIEKPKTLWQLLYLSFRVHGPPRAHPPQGRQYAPPKTGGFLSRVGPMGSSSCWIARCCLFIFIFKAHNGTPTNLEQKISMTTTNFQNSRTPILTLLSTKVDPFQ